MINSARAYHANRWEVFAAKFFPYRIPFLTKRQRVRIRSYFRNRWRKRLCNLLVSLMEGVYADNHLKELNLKWSIEDYEWEVTTSTESEKYEQQKKEIMEKLKIYADMIEPEALNQIYAMAKSDAYKDNIIRMMPDCHAGKGCTVGTTMMITDKITPNFVGVDIGCTVSAHRIKFPRKSNGREWFDTVKEKLDTVIREHVPSGCNIRKSLDDVKKRTRDRVSQILGDLIADVNVKYNAYSIGTLGGGNHFISVEWCEETNEVYLLIHCGSRHLGVEVCKYWQTKAIKNRTCNKGEVGELIKRLKAEGREKEIQTELKKIERPKVSNELAYLDLNLEPEDFRGYLHDMTICQSFARMNHETIADIIAKHMGWRYGEEIFTMHNYIDTESMILRKGAVSANYGENLIIPMNMRDGSLICVGKGNVDWNYSAPHGAGRMMSRSRAKEELTMEEFKESMKGIYTTSVSTATIDEAPMAYKPMEAIIYLLEETAEIVKRIKPLYNFKAEE